MREVLPDGKLGPNILTDEDVDLWAMDPERRKITMKDSKGNEFWSGSELISTKGRSGKIVCIGICEDVATFKRTSMYLPNEPFRINQESMESCLWVVATTKKTAFTIMKYKSGKARIRVGNFVGDWHCGNGDHEDRIDIPVGLMDTVTPIIEAAPDFVGDVES